MFVGMSSHTRPDYALISDRRPDYALIMTSSKLLKTSASTSIPPNASLALKNCSIVYKNTSTERVEETTAALPG